ncbi:DNA polymerase subunit gamma-2, mitochondrial-like [Mercenaria mercenaria]|uniref:DNA polymerase subunit gamma-2, mitochondrial-like n=1 Tax=Mercenaria mercenaria TaxID=6596 RepID=UPI00234F214C|nr:DNA polymerase subunit gamma-2, mitochondrial-like [Mercenaria mercenaria]
MNVVCCDLVPTMTQVPSWDKVLKLLKKTQYLYGPGLSQLRENVRKMWLDRMVTKAESSFLIDVPADPLEYYPQLLALRNEHIPFSIAHVCSRTADLSSQSEHLKPLWNFGPETCFTFLHFCPQASVNTTYDQLVNVRFSWWKQLSYNSSDFTLSNMEENSAVLSGRRIQYKFPWGLETVETICNLGDEHLKKLQQKTKSNCQYSQGKKCIYPSQIQCDMTLEMATALFLKDAYVEKSVKGNEVKQVLHLSPVLAPFKVAVCRQGERHEEISEVTTYIASMLRKHGHQILDTCHTKNHLNMQLNRFDEMGVPFTVIVSDSTIETGTVQIRNRDTGIQETLAIGDLPLYVTKHVTYQAAS